MLPEEEVDKKREGILVEREKKWERVPGGPGMGGGRGEVSAQAFVFLLWGARGWGGGFRGGMG